MFLSLLLPACLLAQQAQIIDIKGEVMVKETPASQWQKAKTAMTLGKDAEIETKENAFCAISFDKNNNKIVTLKQNTRVKIDRVEPGAVYLPKGRVISLINKMPAGEKFQIRTPTAIAGARGTGWITNFNGIVTLAQCYENTIFVQGLDDQGNPTTETDVSSGMETNVGRGGIVGDPSPLGDSDYSEWNDFTGYSNGLTSGDNQGDAGGNAGGTGGLADDLRNDQRDDLRENSQEQARREEAPVQSDTGSGETEEAAEKFFNTPEIGE